MIVRSRTVMLALSALLGAVIAAPGAWAANITRGGQPAELTVTSAGAHSVRVTLKPVGLALPPSPSLLTLDINNPAIRLRTIDRPVQARVGAVSLVSGRSPEIDFAFTGLSSDRPMAATGGSATPARVRAR